MVHRKKKTIDTTTFEEQEAFFMEFVQLATTGQKPSNAILNQEAQGQSSFVASTQLPVDGTKGKEDVFAKIGIRLGNIPTEGDTLFRDAELSEGWKKKPTDHSMWSTLVDVNGNERAAIFYKAAFYDRSAHIQLRKRYSVEKDYSDHLPDTKHRYVAYDNWGGNRIEIHFVEADVPSRKNDIDAYYVAIDKLGNLGVEQWMFDHYPEWQDPSTYWDTK